MPRGFPDGLWSLYSFSIICKHGLHITNENIFSYRVRRVYTEHYERQIRLLNIRGANNQGANDIPLDFMNVGAFGLIMGNLPPHLDATEEEI